MARRRTRFGNDDSGERFHALCYFTRLLSSGVDDAKTLPTEAEALKFAKKCVKDGRGANPHAVITSSTGGTILVQKTRTGRLQVKRR